MPVSSTDWWRHAATSCLFRAAALASCILCLAPVESPAAEWPQWRGPGGQGHAESARGLPTTWGETEHVAWRTELPGKGWSSPVIAGDRIWLTAAVETRLSEAEERRRLGGNFSSSPLCADGRIYVGNQDGSTFVLRPGREFVLEATNRLDGRIMATPAAVDGAIYLRTDKALYRIEKP